MPVFDTDRVELSEILIGGVPDDFADADRTETLPAAVGTADGAVVAETTEGDRAGLHVP
jgi:hypothetical protein